MTTTIKTGDITTAGLLLLYMGAYITSIGMCIDMNISTKHGDNEYNALVLTCYKLPRYCTATDDAYTFNKCTVHDHSL